MPLQARDLLGHPVPGVGQPLSGVLGLRQEVEQGGLGLGDEGRGVVAAQGDPARLDPPIGKGTEVAVGDRKAWMPPRRGKDQPAVNAFQGDRDAGLPLDGLEQRGERVRRVGIGVVDEQAVHVHVQDGETEILGEGFGLEQQLTAARGDRLMQLHPTEAGVLVAQVAETHDQQPLERGLAGAQGGDAAVLGWQGLQPPLERQALVQEGLQRARDQARRGIGVAQGFRGDVGVDHDRRIHRGEVNLGDLGVHPEQGLVDQPAAVVRDQVGQGAWGLGLGLGHRDEDAFAQGGLHLQGGDPGAGRLARCILHPQAGHARQFEHPVQADLVEQHRIAAVNVPAPAQVGLGSAVEHLAVGEERALAAKPHPQGRIAVGVELGRHLLQEGEEPGIAIIAKDDIGIAALPDRLEVDQERAQRLERQAVVVGGKLEVQHLGRGEGRIAVGIEPQEAQGRQRGIQVPGRGEGVDLQ